MVRYPAKERQAISTLENMHIRTASGEAIAIGEVAELTLGTGLTAIERMDRMRTVTVTAEINVDQVQSGDVIEDVREKFVPQLIAKYPSVEFRLSGGSQEQREYYVKLGVGLLASLFMIYGLLAVPLRSYIQPLVIMSVIPFGFIGAVIGHVLFGISVNMMSIFGIIALAGVVVNDSLILVEFANRGREANQTIEQSILDAGQKRFRAILLTTLTTFVGLLPLLFETSLQAQWVIPMALSLSFGILFASTITLLLIPCLYLVVETNQRLIKAILTAILLIAIVLLTAASGIFSFAVAGTIASLVGFGAICLVVMRMMGYFPEKAS
jgi:multidrug efflux pump subunit AcrB